MIRILIGLALLGGILAQVSDSLIPLAAAVLIIGFCLLWVWAARNDWDVRTMAEASAEKRARLAAEEMAEMQRRGRPFRA